MNKIQLGPSTIAYPMPAFLIGADVDGRPNFMVAAWSGIACSDPPMLTVAFQPHRKRVAVIQGARANLAPRIDRLQLVAMDLRRLRFGAAKAERLVELDPDRLRFDERIAQRHDATPTVAVREAIRFPLERIAAG